MNSFKHEDLQVIDAPISLDYRTESVMLKVLARFMLYAFQATIYLASFCR